MNKEQSFAQKIKEELANNTLENSDDKNIAILSSFIKINGSLKIKNGKELIVLKTENSKIAKAIFKLLDRYFSCKPKLLFEKGQKLEKALRYHIVVENNTEEILDRLNIKLLDDKVHRSFLNSDDKKHGYFAGAFMAAGSCNSPESSNYHLEIRVNSPAFAVSLQSLLNYSEDFPFNFRMIKRREEYVLYIKKSDIISDFLIMIGAVSCCLEYENVRIDRDVINTQNRLINIEGANYFKQVKSSQKQIELINFLEEHNPRAILMNPTLRLYCNLRKANPDASMTELANLMGKELETSVSKGKINHLSRKVEELVEEYGKKID